MLDDSSDDSSNSVNCVRRPIFVRQKSVGVGLVREALGLGVPFEVRLRLVGDVADQGGGRVAVADLDVAVAGLPAADAVEEVAGVQVGRGASPILKAEYGEIDEEEMAGVPEGFATQAELDSFIAKLEAEMREAAKKFEFEKAARLRDTIKELREKEFLFG